MGNSIKSLLKIIVSQKRKKVDIFQVQMLAPILLLSSLAFFQGKNELQRYFCISRDVRYAWGSIFPFGWNLCSNGIVASDCDILRRMIDLFQLLIVIFLLRTFSDGGRTSTFSFPFLTWRYFSWWFHFSRRTYLLHKHFFIRNRSGKRLSFFDWPYDIVQLLCKMTSGSISTILLMSFWPSLLRLTKWLTLLLIISFIKGSLTSRRWYLWFWSILLCIILWKSLCFGERIGRFGWWGVEDMIDIVRVTMFKLCHLFLL